MRDWLAVLAEPGKMQLDGLPHFGQDGLFGICQCDTARQIWAPRAISAVARSFDHDRVAGHGVLRSSPACLRMLRSVPGGNSALGLPAIVTRPGFRGACTAGGFPQCSPGTHLQPRSASLSHGPSAAMITPSRTAAPRPEMEPRGRAARLRHATGSLRQWTLLRQARPGLCIPASVVTISTTSGQDAQNSPRMIDVAPEADSGFRIKPPTCVGTAGFEPATP